MLLATLLAAATVQTVEPRAYGYVVGDLVERRVLLAQPLAPAALPRRGRIDAWLELREAQLVGGSTQELRLVYQIVNAPKQVATIELPALALATSQSRSEVDAWPITVSAMTPAFALARAGLDESQPDIAPERADLRPVLVRMAAVTLLLAALVYAVALARWPQLAFWRRDAPFRSAWLELRRLARHRPAEAEAALAQRAMQRLHAAFDAAAGQALFAERLDALYVARPQLRPLAGDIERFYAQSRSAFFAATPATPALAPLVELARRLTQAEALP
jgi:mxaA protein